MRTGGDVTESTAGRLLGVWEAKLDLGPIPAGPQRDGVRCT